MTEVTIIGVDLAKQVFQAHGAAADGSVVFRRKLSRGQFLSFLAGHPRCVVAMELVRPRTTGAARSSGLGMRCG